MIQYTYPIVKLNILVSASIPEESADLFLGTAMPSNSSFRSETIGDLLACCAHVRLYH